MVAWETSYSGRRDRQISARTFSPEGITLAERDLLSGELVGLRDLVALDHGFAIFLDKNFSDQYGAPIVQVLDEHLVPQGDFTELPFRSPAYQATWSAARLPEGFALLSRGEDLPEDPDCIECSFGVFLYFVNESGQASRPPVRVNVDTTGSEQPPLFGGGLASDEQGHLIAVFWRFRKESPEDYDVYIRRFTATGDPLGPEIRVNTFLPGKQEHPQVAVAPDGRSIVVWQSEAQDGDFEGIYAQRFSANGQPVGSEFRVNSFTRSAQRFPEVAMDQDGNFAVTWQSFFPEVIGNVVPIWDVMTRLFRADGTPVANEVMANQERRFEQVGPGITFAPNGTLLIGWGSSYETDPGSYLDAYARRYAASPGQEPCAVASSRLLCDTGRTGGTPELDTAFGGRPGEVTLLGDWDGDGRDDVCAWFAGRFRCDLDHEGPPVEVALRFGLSNDVPLLGDVDGDGRAEPCVKRKRRLLCDTGHDGGRAETTVVLGRGTEVPLLGDLDGDGKDDLCLFDQGQWLCKTRQDAVVRLTFGGPGDLPALGDLDRDGRAEPCLLRGGTLSCDTARDGGAAEQSFEMALPPGARPLFGNLDGL